MHQPAVAAEHVHQEPRVHATADHLHNVAAIPEHVHESAQHAPDVAGGHEQSHMVSGLASPAPASLSDHLGNLFSGADRVHSEEHVHSERVHAEEHLHQEHVHH